MWGVTRLGRRIGALSQSSAKAVMSYTELLHKVGHLENRRNNDNPASLRDQIVWSITAVRPKRPADGLDHVCSRSRFHCNYDLQRRNFGSHATS